MFRFFRIIRQKLLAENKLSRYLLYAIGEIVLVVIGILIALQINNWNASKQQERQLRAIYELVGQDLRADRKLIESNFLPRYERLDSMLRLTVEGALPSACFDTINDANFGDCGHCDLKVTGGPGFFKPTNKGNNLLINFDDGRSGREDSLNLTIVQFYNMMDDAFKTAQVAIVDIILKNTFDLERMSWYADYGLGVYNPDYIDYLQGAQYRNKAMVYRQWVTKYYMLLLNNYLENITEVIAHIDRYLVD